MRMRGISPVVATALLVLIAIATAALLYLWVSGTVSNQPEEPALQEKIKIETVSYKSTDKNLTVYIRNIGLIPVNVTTLYVIDSVTGEIVYSNTSINWSIEPGEVKAVSFKLNDDLQAGKPYIIKAVTLNGVEATYVYVRK